MQPAESSPRTIGLIAPQLSSLYFGELISGVQSILHPQQLRLLAIQGTPLEVGAARLGADYVRGWIILNNADQIERLAAQGKPIVTVGAIAAGQPTPAVLPDNANGMCAAVAHLIGHGHRAIAFMGSLAHFDTRQRYEGYLSALAAAGITADPALCIDLPENVIARGHASVGRLLQLGCTAVAAATDELAIGVLTALGELGDSQPASLAVVGFDNILPAQSSRPPLTTVHVSATAIGAAAAALMLRQLAGEADLPPLTYVPTTLIVRKSCGCSMSAPAATPAGPAVQLAWGEALGRRLVQLLTPGAAEPRESYVQIWPAGQVLIQGLSAALDGTGAVSHAAIVQACAATAMLSSDLDAVMAVGLELEREGIRQMGGRADTPAQLRLAEYLAAVRAEVARNVLEHARLIYWSALDQVWQNQEASLRLLASADEDARDLAWMQVLPFAAGCLGLWGAGTQLRVAGTYGAVGALPSGVLPAPSFPPATLLAGKTEPADALTVLAPIRSATYRWGVLALATTAGYLRSAANYNTLGVLAVLLELALNRQQLRERVASEQARSLALSQQVRELSCPVIPLLHDVLLVPLIGTLDATRIPQIIEAVLQGITEHQAAEVLIDITGVPLVDTQAANALVQTAQAATLLGARVTLVGIRPEIAQSIVGLGIDLRLIATEATLSAAMRRLVRAG